MMPARPRVAAAALLLALAVAVLLAAQEKYPNRPIDFIAPWRTGGGADARAGGRVT